MTEVAKPATPREPIRAWKTARLGRAVDGKALVLLPLMSGDPYEVEARARCASDSYRWSVGTHTADSPDPRCSCGFYAVRQLQEYEVNRANAVLEVELAGRVVVGTEGYRAGWQRVLTVYLPSAGCGLVLNHQTQCRQPTAALVQDSSRNIYNDNESTFTLAPRCLEHIGATELAFTPQRLTELLGTDVRIEPLPRILARSAHQAGAGLEACDRCGHVGVVINRHAPCIECGERDTYKPI